MTLGVCQCLKVIAAKPSSCATCAIRSSCPVKSRHEALLARRPPNIHQLSIISRCATVHSSYGQWPTAENIESSLQEAGVIDLCRSGCAEARDDTCDTRYELEILAEEARAHGWEVGFLVFSCTADTLYQIGRPRLAENPPRGTAC